MLSRQGIQNKSTEFPFPMESGTNSQTLLACHGLCTKYAETLLGEQLENICEQILEFERNVEKSSKIA